MADAPLKLYVVGERSANPDDWDDDYYIVVASSPEEALRLADKVLDWEKDTPVTEILLSKACVLAYVPMQVWNS